MSTGSISRVTAASAPKVTVRMNHLFDAKGQVGPHHTQPTIYPTPLLLSLPHPYLPSPHQPPLSLSPHCFCPSPPLPSQTVGRVAQRVAALLTGKGMPSQTPLQDSNDRVTVINAAHVQFTGRRWDRKIYRYHTGHPGGLKEIPARLMLEKHPTLILRKAVLGMIKHNKHRVPRMERLSVWPGEEPPKGKAQGMPLQQVQAALRQRSMLKEDVRKRQAEAMVAPGGLPVLTEAMYETLMPTSPVIRKRWEEQVVRLAKEKAERQKAEDAEQEQRDRDWKEGKNSKIGKPRAA